MERRKRGGMRGAGRCMEGREKRNERETERERERERE